MEPKYVTVTIDPKGKSMKVDMENFHGQGCGALMEAFDTMGATTHEEFKPEYDEPHFNGNFVVNR